MDNQASKPHDGMPMPRFGQIAGPGQDRFLTPTLFVLGDKSEYIAANLRDQAKDIAKDLSHGQFGIREPSGHCIAVPPNRLDLILVPGVAFDSHGRRLGRGKGFYDQLLESVRGTTCGVAFDEQIVESVPVEPHDVHLNCILTPTRWIEP